MSEQEKPSPEEIERLLRREAYTRRRLSVARARALLLAHDNDAKATFHYCRAYAIANTEVEFKAHEQARVKLLTAMYIVNGTLVGGVDNQHYAL